MSVVILGLCLCNCVVCRNWVDLGFGFRISKEPPRYQLFCSLTFNSTFSFVLVHSLTQESTHWTEGHDRQATKTGKITEPTTDMIGYEYEYDIIHE